MAPLKAPGLDGLHAVFYQNTWSVIGENVVNMVENLFTLGELLEGMNNTNIAFIP